MYISCTSRLYSVTLYVKQNGEVFIHPQIEGVLSSGGQQKADSSAIGTPWRGKSHQPRVPSQGTEHPIFSSTE